MAPLLSLLFLVLCSSLFPWLVRVFSRTGMRLFVRKKSHFNFFLVRIFRWWFLGGMLLFAISAALSRVSPILGVMAPLFGMAATLTLFWMRGEHKRLEAAESGLVLLHTLHGLLRGGFGLPAALAVVGGEGGFSSRKLNRNLGRMVAGVSLRESLARMKKLHQGTPLEIAWQSVALAYSRNVSVDRPLESLLPVIDRWNELDRLLFSLRKAVVLQIAIASFLPWILFAFLAYLNPDVSAAALNSRGWPAVVAFCIFYQGIGGWLTWKASQFF